METFDYVSLQRKIAEQPKLFETETRGPGNYADNRPRRDRARWFPSTGVRRSGGQTAEVRWSRNYRTLRGVSSRCRSREQETSKKWFWRVALLLSRGVLFLLSSSPCFLPVIIPHPLNRFYDLQDWRLFSLTRIIIVIERDPPWFFREMKERNRWGMEKAGEVSIARRKSICHPSPVSSLT